MSRRQAVVGLSFSSNARRFASLIRHGGTILQVFRNQPSVDQHAGKGATVTNATSDLGRLCQAGTRFLVAAKLMLRRFVGHRC